MIDGVCGGVSEYFEVDPTIVRVLWVLFTLLGGAGFILYIVGMVIMPANPNQFYTLYPNDAVPGATEAQTLTDQSVHKKHESRRFWGVALMLVGALALLTNLGIFADMNWFSLSWEVVFPGILIAVGIWLLYVQTQGKSHASAQAAYEQSSAASAASTDGAPDFTMPGQAPPAVKELRRSIMDRKLMGVCGGIAKYIGADPTLVRIAYVALTICSAGWGLLLYLILAFLIPEEKLTITY
jgi:phage shock protein C